MFHLNLLILIITLVLTGVTGKSPQRIKGGDESSRNDFHFMVGVKTERRFCSGVLISKLHVLTAAQCLTNSTTDREVIHKSSIQIIHYRNNMMNIDNSEIYEVSHMNVHGTWIQQTDSRILEADIAILKINREVHSIETMDIAKLAIITPTIGSEGLTLGWNSEKTDGKLNFRLQEASTKVLDHEICRREKYPELAVHAFCTQSVYNDATISDSDIGGPFINDKGQIAGIVSHTTECMNNSVNIFTDILSYKPWIQRILKLETSLNPNMFSMPDKHGRLYEKL